MYSQILLEHSTPRLSPLCKLHGIVVEKRVVRDIWFLPNGNAFVQSWFGIWFIYNNLDQSYLI